MKYRFRPSNNTPKKRLMGSRRLRLMGRDTLSRLGSLPVPVEQIKLGEDKKHTFSAKKIIKKLVAYANGLISYLSGLLKKTVTGILKELRGGARALFRHLTKEKPRTPANTFLGALTGAFSVCVISAAYVLLALFGTYAKPYTAVTIPSFTGKTVDEARRADEQFNLIITYEDNPDIAGNTVITQFPPSGVTRRIYGKDGVCDVHITVSRQRSYVVPDGIEGSSLRDARLSLLNSGLSPRITERYSQSVPSGRIIEVYPQSGSKISPKEPVVLIVSKGADHEKLEIPY